MTFSIVALNRRTETLGIATASGTTSVGKRVPHIQKMIAAIAIQGLAEKSYGILGLKLLSKGHFPQAVLTKMVNQDPMREHRQVIIIDIFGRKAAFTGLKTLDDKKHIIGDDFVVAGNLLANKTVILHMVEAYKSNRKFVEKLYYTLEAGAKAGGDKRGIRSAALMISPKTGKDTTFQIDNNNTPLLKLKQLLKIDT
jgi:uncharacterized Ntn-hydrolase superfamily protein